MREMYETRGYLDRNPSWHVEESPWKATQIERMIDRAGINPMTVCEVGCGAGEVLRQLQQRRDPSCELWGYDVSPHAIEMARSRANARLHFALARPGELPGDPVDLVLLLDVIEHVEDHLSLLRAIRRKGRTTILHIPLDLSVQTLLRPRGLLHVREAYGHIHYFTKDTALQALRDAGHEVLDWFYTARAVDMPGTRRRQLLKCPRRLMFALNADLAVRIIGGWSLLVLTR